jgi:hypothetical protein
MNLVAKIGNLAITQHANLSKEKIGKKISGRVSER